jgi:hypothetical protein
LSQQRYFARAPEHKNVIEVSRKRSDEILAMLVAKPCYKALTANQQKDFARTGKWHPGISIADMIARSGFSGNFPATYYSSMSSYSHSESISQMQVAQADYMTAQKLSDPVRKALFMTAAFYLRGYYKLFPPVEKKIEDRDRDFYLSWCEVGTRFAANY